MANTFFFRDIQTLNTIAKYFIPYVSGRSRIRVWDAGCSIGAEPYSLALVLAESMGKFAFNNLQIIASDYELEFKNIVTNAVYPKVELERLPEDIFKKYFHPDEKPDHFVLDDYVKSKVDFLHHDLLSLESIGENFSLVMCKNVLLHFQQEERIEVMKMFHKSLDIGGLFATEHTQKLPRELSNLFEQVSLESQLYRKI